MKTFPMPAHAPFDDFAYRFVDDFVFMSIPDTFDEKLPTPTPYLVRLATKDFSILPLIGSTFTFDRKDWEEIVRLLDLSATDPMQAIYEAWLQWDDSIEIPECAQRLHSEGTREAFWNLAMRIPVDADSAPGSAKFPGPHFPRPFHGPEGSDA